MIVALGSAVLVVGAMHPHIHQPMRFVCYLLVAVAASRLKVNLPGITGTMSVNFLFILLGILELSFAETLALGCAAILTQCFYRDRPNAVQVVFNTCATVVSPSRWPIAFITCRCSRAQNNPAVLLVATAAIISPPTRFR